MKSCDISITAFAKAMLEQQNDSFSKRVKKFELKHGIVDEDTLAILAQAGYYCWGNCHYKDNLLQVCRAIGTGKTTYLYLHNQVNPERWIELNTYVVAVQKWLGNGHEVPEIVTKTQIDRIYAWLGKQDTIKKNLTTIFLDGLIRNLLIMNLCKLGKTNERDEYNNFSPWYELANGQKLGLDNDILKKSLVKKLETSTDDIKEILKYLLQEKPHSCMHRFTRHLDIQLSSIGALKWRENPPEDNIPVTAWEKFITKNCGLHSWLKEDPPENNYAAQVHELLGSIDKSKKTIITEFLLSKDRGSIFTSDWIDEQTEKMGSKAYQLSRS